MAEINFYNIDCIEFMKTKPDNYYDLAIVDPPYGIGMDGGNVGYKGFNNFQKKNWDKEIPSKEYFEELFRVSFILPSFRILKKRRIFICKYSLSTRYIKRFLGKNGIHANTGYRI